MMIFESSASSSLGLRVVSGVDDRTMKLKRLVVYWSALNWLGLKNDWMMASRCCEHEASFERSQ